MAELQTEVHEELQVIVFRIGEEYYGIDITKVQGIEMVEGYTNVPDTNNDIKGIINLRGDIIPVFSIRKKFGMEDSGRKELQLIIVRVGSRQIAFEIDAIDKIQNITEEMVFEVPIIVRNKDVQYYDMVLHVDGRIIIVLNTEKMLSEAEKASVNQLVRS